MSQKDQLNPYGPATVIFNKRAGKGSKGDEIERLLAGTGLDYEIKVTEGKGHATELAATAVGQGSKYLIAVGGDGTINEVVNGLMGPEGPIDPECVVGVIPAGSGSDFIRTFGLPQRPEDAVQFLLGEQYFQVDVGKLTCTDPKGEQVTRYFANIAEAGLGGDVVRRAEGLPRWLGRVRYLLSFWMTFMTFKSGQGSVGLDKRNYEGRVTNLVVANGQFFGGGMRIAPKAHPADGKFDVLIQKGSKRDWLTGITKVYKAEHLPSPMIKEHHSARVELRSNPELTVEADGEVLGKTPATFEIVKDAFRLKI